MKNFLWVATALLLMNCTRTNAVSDSGTATSLSFNTSAELQLQQSRKLGEITLQLQNLEDSRCPMNANCIRQGSAVVTVQVKDNQGHAETKQLYLGEALPAPDNRGSHAADTVKVVLGNKKYELILHDVQPYPNTSAATSVAQTAAVTLRHM